VTALDPRALRAAFGSFMTGVTVVTTRDAKGTPVGFTANSFTSVSLDPPMLLVCPSKFISSFEIFEQCQHFAVSILAEGQEEVSNVFAGYEGDRFTKVAWEIDAKDLPLITGAVAHFSCRTDQVIPAGDHVVLIGEITEFTHSAARGLGYAEGQYFSLGLEREAASAPGKGVRAFAGAIVTRDGHVLLEETDAGWRLPIYPLSDRSQVREALGKHLTDAGLTVNLGAAYSLYDDRAEDAHHTFFLAEALDDGTGGLGQYVPVESLKELAFASPALGIMMRRFSFESETGNFALYVGDETAGAKLPV